MLGCPAVSPFYPQKIPQCLVRQSLILDGESLWNHHCSSLSHSFSWLNPYFSCLKTPFIILKSPFFLEHVKTIVKTTQLTQMFALVTSHLRCPASEARCAARRDGLQRQRHPRRGVRCRGEPRGVARGAGLPAVPRCPGGSHHGMGKTVEPWGCEIPTGLTIGLCV